MLFSTREKLLAQKIKRISLKILLLFIFSFLLSNHSYASGTYYFLNPWCGDQPCSPCEGASDGTYTNLWVQPASNSTLFAPTLEAYYDFCLLYTGFKGSVTIGSSGNNCDYVGTTRFCARLADINENGNTFACDSSGDTCSGSSCGSICSAYNGNSAGTPGNPYYCLGYYDNSKATEYYCNNGGYYDCNCPNCRNVCAMRLCAYQDPASSDSITEECDDITSCMSDSDSSDFSNNPWMPYFENEQVAYKTIWGTNQYFNTDGGDFVGCVDVPLGPFPPPYCSPIIGSVPAPSVQPICEYSSIYSGFDLTETACSTETSGNCMQTSTSTAVCELSTTNGDPGSTPVYSTFSNPLVRIYFSNPLNICSSDYKPPSPLSPGNDTCVYIYPSSPPLTPTEIWDNNEVLFPVCSSDAGASTENCVKFPSGRTTGPSGTTTVFGSDYKYFRAYFNEASGTDPTAQIFYGSDIASELTLYGINDSQYADIGDFSGATSSSSYSYTNFYGITRYYNTIDISDYEDNTHVYGGFIDLGCDPYTGMDTQGSGDGSQFCVDEISEANGTNPVGCYSRPQMFQPTVSECLTNSECSYESSSNIVTQPRISVTVGNSYTNVFGTAVEATTGVIGVDILSTSAPVSFCVLDDNHTTAQQASNSTTVSESTSACNTDGTIQENNLSPCTLNQYYGFSAYITDDINYTITDDPSATNGTKTPYASGVQYTGGMQYVDYVYCRGATQICLSGYNNSGLVVTKMVPVTTTSSSGQTTTTYQPSQILTDRIIPPYQQGESYPLSQNTNSTSEEVSQIVFGYLDTATDQYIENSSCTTTTTMTCCAANPSDGETCATGSIAYPSNAICYCTSAAGDSTLCTPLDCNKTFQSEVSVNSGGLYNESVNNYYSTSTVTTTYIGYQDSSGDYIPGNGCTTTDGMVCCVPDPTDSSQCATASSNITYPAAVTCTCTNSVGDVTTCSGASQCTVAYQTTTTTDNTMIGYQISGNQLNNSVTNNDSMSSPWTNCTYNSTEDITICYANDNNGNPQFGTRPLNSMELAQCVELVTPYCNAIDSTDGYSESNGYAQWNQTAAGAVAQGTCISSNASDAGPPTRSCLFQDSGTTSSNGCPVYSQQWGTVTNPCVVAPPWWPGSFLAGNSNYLGAIINQFNVSYDYRSAVNSTKYLTPTSANADPFNLYSTSVNTQYSSSSVITNSSANSPIAPEPWNSCFSSCKKDGLGKNANYARNKTDGDQEMLYLTQNQWYDLWNGNDIQWTLASPDNSSNDGCRVYSLCLTYNSSGQCLTANISADFAGINPSMKICKYQDNISFALVDLGLYNSTTNTYQYATDYTNVNYLMQSNVLAYPAYIYYSKGVSPNNNCFSTTDTTQYLYLTNNISGKTSTYDTRINNGIVVNRGGFNFSDYDDSGTLPTGFVQCNSQKCGTCVASSTSSCTYMESINMQYNFTHFYQGSYSEYDLGVKTGTGHTSCDYYNPTNQSGQGGVYNQSYSSMESLAPNTVNYYSTIYPLALFSNITLNPSTASSTNYASSYLKSSTFDSSYSYYYTPNLSSIWLPKGCDKDDEVDQCQMGIILNDYIQGNSAANPAMFLWNGADSYNIVNTIYNSAPTYGSYGQLSK